jgi:hypothetical protein|uniref:Uncharacterized protein n=1 Tax=viral metagenome TaxID=1070528 RepID=A0A6C0IZD6_9ZZZZ
MNNSDGEQIKNACNYANLGNYNNGNGISTGSPTAAGSGSYVVPSYGPGMNQGYDVLNYGGVTCSGHPTISNAYPASSNLQYVTRSCKN